MNDRFKFRSWHIPTKTMEYNGLWTGKNWDKKLSDCNFILMQCTGLKDKNGKLIYEGDILKQPQLPHKVVCEWYKDGYWLNGFMNGAKRELRNIHNWYEVIGNIYENPELIERI